jgi:CBS domain-containing protein
LTRRATSAQYRRFQEFKGGTTKMSIRSVRSVIAGQTPVTAAKSATVFEAAVLMKQQSKGALLVVDGTRLIGIFTERDIVFRVVAPAAIQRPRVSPR